MESDHSDDESNRLVSGVLAVVLSLLALRWLKEGKRGRGLLAGIGAVGAGVNAKQETVELDEYVDVDTTLEELDTVVGEESEEPVEVTIEDDPSTSEHLECAFCGDPIEPGQRRGPNEQGQIVHDDCV